MTRTYKYYCFSIANSWLSGMEAISHASSSTMHIHLSEKDCLEAIAVKGDAEEIRKLSNELSSTRRGVKILKTMIVSL